MIFKICKICKTMMFCNHCSKMFEYIHIFIRIALQVGKTFFRPPGFKNKYVSDLNAAKKKWSHQMISTENVLQKSYLDFCGI